MASRKLKDALKALGKEYQERRIDWEPCIYRDLGNGYDIEVSGVEVGYSVRGQAFDRVYVWRALPGGGHSLVTTAYGEAGNTLKGLKGLKCILDRMVETYGD